jgi:hypothetical protein
MGKFCEEGKFCPFCGYILALILKYCV